jgi:hypothetical protein
MFGESEETRKLHTRNSLGLAEQKTLTSHRLRHYHPKGEKPEELKSLPSNLRIIFNILHMFQISPWE